METKLHQIGETTQSKQAPRFVKLVQHLSFHYNQQENPEIKIQDFSVSFIAEEFLLIIKVS